MKVAQYEVLGDDSIRDVRPGSGRDDRNARPLISRIRIHKQKESSIVPSGTGGPSNANPALRTGLLSLGPSGTIFLSPVKLPRRLMLTRMG
jgi:hypothetical protein